MVLPAACSARLQLFPLPYIHSLLHLQISQWDGSFRNHHQWRLLEYLSLRLFVSPSTQHSHCPFLRGWPFSFIWLSSEVEWIPTRERTLVGTLTSFFFTFGQMILAGLAYWLRDWRKLQALVCAPHFLFFAYSWSVPTVTKCLQNSLFSVSTGITNVSALSLVRWYSESARWLVLRNRFDDALNNLKRVARINGKPEVIDKLTKEVTHLSPLQQ